MATRGAPPANLPAKVTSLPPNQTLYVTNIPSAKITKDNIRIELYMLFSTYGSILDIVTLKTMKMRGQAHIVYKDIQTATLAMRALDGFEFFGMKLKISYGKGRSNIISKLDGSFKPPTTSTAAGVEVTDLQQSIFNAPVPGAPAPSTSTASALLESQAAGLPSKPSGTDSDNRGVKRTRDEEEDESDSDVAMEEDSDDE
ncbi:U2 small nuclear ribonucleoprotein B' [Rhypophila decipiens]